MSNNKYDKLEKQLNIRNTVNDINILRIPNNKLEQILTKLDSLSSRDDINKLLFKFGETNAINPNGTVFHATSVNSIIKYNKDVYSKKN